MFGIRKSICLKYNFVANWYAGYSIFFKFSFQAIVFAAIDTLSHWSRLHWWIFLTTWFSASNVNTLDRTKQWILQPNSVEPSMTYESVEHIFTLLCVLLTTCTGKGRGGQPDFKSPLSSRLGRCQNASGRPPLSYSSSPYASALWQGGKTRWKPSNRPAAEVTGHN